MSDVRPWYACTGDPCTCPKPATPGAENARRLVWFTDDELRAELQRRAAVDDGRRFPLADVAREMGVDLDANGQPS